MEWKEWGIVSGIYYPDIGGPATYVRNLLKMGIKVKEVITYGDKSFLEEGVKVIKIRRRIKGLGKIYFFIRLLTMTLVLSKRKENKYLVTDVSVAGIPAYLAKKIAHKKYVVRFVGDWVYETSSPTTTLENFYISLSPLRKIQAILERRVLRNAEKIIVPSNYLKKFLIHFHTIPPKKIEVIYNAVPINEEPHYHNREGFLSCGRGVKWKNFDLLTEVFCELGIDIKIVGEGREIEKAHKKCNKIKILGKANPEELKEIMEKHQYFILLSSYEGQSHVILEAMERGMIVIASDLPPNREIIRHGKTGFLVPLNKEHIKNKIPYIISLPKTTKEKIAREARKYVTKEHNWEKHIERLERVLKC